MSTAIANNADPIRIALPHKSTIIEEGPGKGKFLVRDAYSNEFYLRERLLGLGRNVAENKRAAYSVGMGPAPNRKFISSAG